MAATAGDLVFADDDGRSSWLTFREHLREVGAAIEE
jgi:hypothetical protein